MHPCTTHINPTTLPPSSGSCVLTQAGDVKGAGKHMSNAANWYKKTKAAAEAADAERKAEQEKRTAAKDSSSSSSDKQPEAAAGAANGQAEGSPEGITTLHSHAQVRGMHGATQDTGRAPEPQGGGARYTRRRAQA